jgi:hypothetical protein
MFCSFFCSRAWSKRRFSLCYVNPMLNSFISHRCGRLKRILILRTTREGFHHGNLFKGCREKSTLPPKSLMWSERGIWTFLISSPSTPVEPSFGEKYCIHHHRSRSWPLTVITLKFRGGELVTRTTSGILGMITIRWIWCRYRWRNLQQVNLALSLDNSRRQTIFHHPWRYFCGRKCGSHGRFYDSIAQTSWCCKCIRRLY